MNNLIEVHNLHTKKVYPSMDLPYQVRRSHSPEVRVWLKFKDHSYTVSVGMLKAMLERGDYAL